MSSHVDSRTAFRCGSYQNHTALIAYEYNTARRSFRRELKEFLVLLPLVISIETPRSRVDLPSRSTRQRPRPAIERAFHPVEDAILAP